MAPYWGYWTVRSPVISAGWTSQRNLYWPGCLGAVRLIRSRGRRLRRRSYGILLAPGEFGNLI
jgi:hypothetical protein